MSTPSSLARAIPLAVLLGAIPGLSVSVSAPAARADEAPAVRFAKPHLFASHFAVEPRLPVACDLDADGFADLACVYPPDGGIIDVGLSERGLKMHGHTAPARGLFGEAVAAAGRPGEVAWLTGAGVVGVYAAGGAPRRLGEARGGEALLALGDGFLVARRAARWVRFGREGTREIEGPRAWTRVAAFGDTVFWTDGADLHRGQVEGRLLTDEWRRGAGGGDRLVAGDFDGDGRADVLAGTALHLGASAQPIEVGDLAIPEGALVLAADVTGDGRTDLIACRRDERDPHRRRDILVLVSIAPSSTGQAPTDQDQDQDGLADAREAQLGSDPLARDTDEDGIPDGWEVDGYGGFDFAAEGFHPAKKDVLCYVQRRVDADGAHVRRELDRCVAYYATLKQPIQLHIRYLRVLAKEEADGKPWWDLGEANLPLAVRGLAHYMVTGPGGGGQSAQLGTMGGCGANALYATFLHEFGHQVGLDHTGFYKEAWCPLYTSLMNYAYNYGFDGDGAKIHYSAGSFAGVVLDESDLREELPFPIERLRFLEKGPFQFRLEAAGEGRTRIDWNRNGRFDEGVVRADINTSYSTSGGHRHMIGKAAAAPALVSHGGRAYLYTVSQAKRLERRVHEGGQRWSAPETRADIEVTGDPFALAFGERRLVFVPTATGVAFFDDAAASGAVAPSALRLVPASAGCEVAAVALGGRALVFLWREGSLRTAEVVGDGCTEPVAFPIGSTSAPGLLAHASGELWVGVGEDQDANRTSRWRLYRVAVRAAAPTPAPAPADGASSAGGAAAGPRASTSAGSASPSASPSAQPAPPTALAFDVLGSRWVGGEGAWDAGDRRPNLVWEAAEERLHWIATGRIGRGASAHGCFWDAMTIGDRSFRDGWLLKRYYDEWTITPSAVAACWHDGDILLACRWYGSDDLFVAHEGLGIGREPMADFDDQTHIAEVGLSRSILWMAPKPLKPLPAPPAGK